MTSPLLQQIQIKTKIAQIYPVFQGNNKPQPRCCLCPISQIVCPIFPNNPPCSDSVWQPGYQYMKTRIQQRLKEITIQLDADRRMSMPVIYYGRAMFPIFLPIFAIGLFLTAYFNSQLLFPFLYAMLGIMFVLMCLYLFFLIKIMKKISDQKIQIMLKLKQQFQGYQIENSQTRLNAVLVYKIQTYGQ